MIVAATILSFFILLIGLLFSGASNPLSIGLFILVHTLLVCVYFSLISIRFWFSLILFLVFLGGLIIIFIYVASLAPNKWYRYRVESIPVSVRLFLVGLLSLLLSDRGALGLANRASHLYALSEIAGGSGSRLYGAYCYSATGYLVVYLLYALLVVVTLSNVGSRSALRVN